VNHIKPYNESIGSEILKYSLVGSLLFGSVSAENVDKALYSAQKISRITDSTRIKDVELSKILFEIQSKLNTTDTTEFLKLFKKLSTYVESKYNYKIEYRDISKLDEEKAKKLNLFEIIGWIGSICLAICGIPQAWLSHKEKHSHGISWSFLLLWAFGELFALAYVYDKLDAPLLVNYSINILIIGIILFYKINPVKEK
jgi:uncharacterized protein with PQ loop repeat